MPGTGNKYYRINPYPKNTRITFAQYVGSSINDEGVESEKWQTVATRWAYVEHKNGRSIWRNGGFSDKVTDLFRINFDYGFTPTPAMVIFYKGDVYDIESVDNIREENDEIELRAIRYIRSTNTVGEGAEIEDLRIHQ